MVSSGRPYLLPLVLLCAFLFMAEGLRAQSISGHVRDAGSNDPLAGVNVVVEGTSRGVSTDAEGFYRIRDLAPGRYTLAVRYIGYREGRGTVSLAEEDERLDFRLRPGVTPLDEVDVVADRIQAQFDPQPSLVRVEPAQARALPGAGEDVMRALQAAPGVVSTSDFTTQLVVRGGGPDENLIIIDDVEIFNPYRLYGVVSAFNPVIVSDIQLLTGGFPVRHGDRLSSVLRVDIREGTTTDRLAGSVNTSLSNANVVLEGLTGWADGSWLLTARRTYYDLILGPIARRMDFLDDDFTFPNFSDLQGKLVLRPGRGHKLQFNGIFSRDVMDIGISGAQPEVGSDLDRLHAGDLTRNDLLTAAWHWAPSNNLLSKTILSWYRNAGTFGSNGRFVPRDRIEGGRLVASQDTVNIFEFGYDQRFLFRKMSAHNQWALGWDGHLLEGGAGLDLLTTTLRFDLWLNDVARAYFESVQDDPFGPGAVPEQFDQAKDYYRYHGYLQNRFSLLNGRLTLQPGLRLDYYRIISQTYLSPRFNLSLAVSSSTTLRGAWGIYRQSPGFEKLLDRGQIFDLSREAGIDNLRAERADHFIIGLTQWLGDRYMLRLEGYNKQFHDLIVQDRGPAERWQAAYTARYRRTDPRAYRLEKRTEQVLHPVPVNDSDGRSYGVEIILEKPRSGPDDRLSGWISYAWSNAYRSRPMIDDPEVYFRVPLDFDRRHVANLVLDYRLGRWSLGATWRFGTGFPYTPGTGYVPVVVQRLDLENPDKPPVVEVLVNRETGLVRFEVVFGGEEDINSERLPDYHRLDLRLTRDFRMFRQDWQFYVDVINVYNRKNIFRYRHAVIIDSEFPEREPRVAREQITMFPFFPSIGFSFVF